MAQIKLPKWANWSCQKQRVLDFEAAGVIGEEPPAIRTFFVSPEPTNPRAADYKHFLASVLYPYEAGR